MASKENATLAIFMFFRFYLNKYKFLSVNNALNHFNDDSIDKLFFNLLPIFFSKLEIRNNTLFKKMYKGPIGDTEHGPKNTNLRCGVFFDWQMYLLMILKPESAF